jgi:hypothetical protein
VRSIFSLLVRQRDKAQCTLTHHLRLPLRMSGLPPVATELRTSWIGSFVPLADLVWSLFCGAQYSSCNGVVDFWSSLEANYDTAGFHHASGTHGVFFAVLGANNGASLTQHERKSCQ